MKVQPVLTLQAELPWALVHDSLQVRQLEVVPFGVSQPALLLQSRKPAFAVPPVVLHATREQVPVEHDAVAFGWLQVTPQSPQSVSVRMLRSQPLPRSPSQLFQPVSQVGEQPAFAMPSGTQVFPPWLLVQVSPQSRQFAEVPSVVSQPAWLEQSARLLSQPVSTH